MSKEIEFFNATSAESTSPEASGHGGSTSSAKYRASSRPNSVLLQSATETPDAAQRSLESRLSATNILQRMNQNSASRLSLSGPSGVDASTSGTSGKPKNRFTIPTDTAAPAKASGATPKLPQKLRQHVSRLRNQFALGSGAASGSSRNLSVGGRTASASPHKAPRPSMPAAAINSKRFSIAAAAAMQYSRRSNQLQASKETEPETKAPKTPASPQDRESVDLLRPLQTSLSCASLPAGWSSDEDDDAEQLFRQSERENSRMLRVCCSIDNLMLSIGDRAQEEKQTEAIFATKQVVSVIFDRSEDPSSSNNRGPRGDDGRAAATKMDGKEAQYAMEFLLEINDRIGKLYEFARTVFVDTVDGLRLQRKELEEGFTAAALKNEQLQSEMRDLRDFHEQNNVNAVDTFAIGTSGSRDAVLDNAFPDVSPDSGGDECGALKQQCQELSRLLEMAKQEIRMSHHERDVQKARVAEISSALFHDIATQDNQYNFVSSVSEDIAPAVTEVNWFSRLVNPPQPANVRKSRKKLVESKTEQQPPVVLSKFLAGLLMTDKQLATAKEESKARRQGSVPTLGPPTGALAEAEDNHEGIIMGCLQLVWAFYQRFLLAAEAQDLLGTRGIGGDPTMGCGVNSGAGSPATELVSLPIIVFHFFLERCSRERDAVQELESFVRCVHSAMDDVRLGIPYDDPLPSHYEELREVIENNQDQPITLETFNNLLLKFAVVPSPEELTARLGPFYQPTGDERKIPTDVFLALLMEAYKFQLQWRRDQLRALFIHLNHQEEVHQKIVHDGDIAQVDVDWLFAQLLQAAGGSSTKKRPGSGQQAGAKRLSNAHASAVTTPSPMLRAVRDKWPHIAHLFQRFSEARFNCAPQVSFHRWRAMVYELDLVHPHKLPFSKLQALFILAPRAFGADNALVERNFAAKLSCPLVGRALLEHRAFLRTVFFYYAKQDEIAEDERAALEEQALIREIQEHGGPPETHHGKDPEISASETKRSSMSFGEFQNFLTAFGLLDAPDFRPGGRHVFSAVMSLDNDDTLQLEFDEFAAATVALAVHLNPSPFTLWHQKVDDFAKRLRKMWGAQSEAAR
uniref:EF-hand domain-containing protein n=1 Tax=Phytophthora ramorum TaxID=164328 RepID=H3HDL9_PHYRM